MNNTTTTWLSQINSVSEHVLAQLEGLETSDRLHIETLAAACEELAPSVPATTLKLMISSLVESTEGFKVVRGKFGGAMRDVPENRPKAELRKEEVAARKSEREQARAQKAADKERAKAEKAAAAARKAEEAAAAAEAATDTSAANDQDSADEASVAV